MRTLETNIEIAAHDNLTPEQELDLTGAGGNIEKTQVVNGGDACVRGTRIPVWGLEEMRNQGRSEGEIVEDFPGLECRKTQGGLGVCGQKPGGNRDRYIRQSRRVTRLPWLLLPGAGGVKMWAYSPHA